MTLAEIETLFAYDSWANGRIIAALQPLSHDELTRDLGTSLGSILGTLVHLIGAEEVWLRRWQGNPRAGIMTTEETPNLSSLEARWRTIEGDRDRFVAGLDDDGLEETMTIQTMSGETFEHRLWQMAQHVANHSSYHRGQIVTMLRQLGHEAPGTDLILFYRERGI